MPLFRVWVSWSYPWGPKISTYTAAYDSEQSAIADAERIYAKRMDEIVRITAEREEE